MSSDGFSNPFNNAHPDPALVALFRGMRQDARSDPRPTALARMAGIELTFDGAGQALVVGMGGYLEVPFDCRLMAARLFADVSCSATVDLTYGTYTDFPAASVLYDTIPTLSSAQKADLAVTNWHRRLAARDVLSYQLASFSGSATRLTLALWVRKTDGPSGAGTVSDAAADTITDSSGNTVTLRT